MKKVYAPVRFTAPEFKAGDSQVIVPVENRQDFSPLERLKISWKIGNETGVVSADIAPKSKGNS
ncbi:MAG: hypothetical protein HC888_03570 [Candidatus Competibacteraceae bacterium]|nr:hypothetical protein [Candidatus Competibacteraceae bacterium]